MATITSHKVGHRVKQHLDGRLVDHIPLAFSAGELVVRLTDGNRNWNVRLSLDETDLLRQRLAEHDAMVGRTQPST